MDSIERENVTIGRVPARVYVATKSLGFVQRCREPGAMPMGYDGIGREPREISETLRRLENVSLQVLISYLSGENDYADAGTVAGHPDDQPPSSGAPVPTPT